MYFSYDPEDGIEFHATEKEAMLRADQAKADIEFHAADSDWNWHDRADEVAWGIVLGKACISDRDLTPEEKAENPEWDFHREYTLEEESIWEPIETAPRGETVLFWVTNGYGHAHVKTGIAYPPAYPDLKFISIYDDGEALGYKPELPECVTHWMALPKSPNSDSSYPELPYGNENRRNARLEQPRMATTEAGRNRGILRLGGCLRERMA